MVTYKHVTEVVRNRYIIDKAKREDSSAILLLIATSVMALTVWIIKQTTTNIAHQTNKLKKIEFKQFILLQYVAQPWT